MKKNKRVERISSGIGLITFGIIALLLTSGTTTWKEIFFFFASFWPIYIMAAGLKLVLIVIDRTKITSILVDLLLSAFIISFLMYSPFQKGIKNTVFNVSKINITENEQIHKEAKNWDSAKSNNYIFNLGATEYEIKDSLYSDSIDVTAENDPLYLNQDYNLKNGTNTVTVSNSDGDTAKLSTILNYENNILIKTSSKLPASFKINTGASKGVISLEDSNIENFDISLGAGELVTIFSKESIPEKMKISLGVGAITIKVPKGTNITINSKVGFGSISVNSKEVGGIIGDNQYILNGSGDANLTINVNVGLGNLDIYEIDVQ